MNETMHEWQVFVHRPGVGYIGTVTEKNEELARCAALSKYGEQNNRPVPYAKAIYENDDFDVRMV